MSTPSSWMAIIFPPLAVYDLDGRSSRVLLNAVLTGILWIPGVIHALRVIREHEQAEAVRMALRTVVRQYAEAQEYERDVLVMAHNGWEVIDVAVSAAATNVSTPEPIVVTYRRRVLPR